MQPLLTLSFSVQQAIAEKKPILAMESTVLTHGLPYPENLEILQTLEELCLELEVEPATIIILDGKIHIGITQAEKENLQHKMKNGEEIQKFGMRDIPYSTAYKKSGGTTVSATMLLACKAGIKVFATGGIGGVHRFWNETLDISTTLEVLESYGVPVLGWKTDEFPAFYSRVSGKKIDRIENAKDVARIYQSMLKLYPYPTGILVANPVPEKDEIPYSKMDKYITEAIAAAKAKNISGKELTPFLLANLAEKTKGQSVQSNLALLKNNIIVGAQIAKELQ